ncbi:MAG: hypothetical protein FJ224_05485 [Lentisphaerae bacterium]|nr:hypothetical protein [Lentisphaerota bacterium]
MTNLAFILLRDRGAFWARFSAGQGAWRDISGLLLFVAGVTGIYGAVMAGWRSPVLSVYVAVKLPLLFLGTAAIVAVFNWMTAGVLGSGLSFRATVLIVLSALTVGCWILLGLLPVVLLFLLSGVPVSGAPDELRYAHNMMLMTHIATLAMAGVAGNKALLGGLRKAVCPGTPVNALFLLWMGAFAFVGCQMSWMLRPFVGSPFYPVAFMRADCLDRNFYEFVFGEVVPFLLTGKR